MSTPPDETARTLDGSPRARAVDDDDGSLRPGASFGRYIIVRKIGMGGMGAVYEAQHTDLNKRVALKTLHREVARNAEARTRFLREGQVASRIRHPHVVDVTDVGVQDGVPYMVMEFFEGHDLATKLEREGPLPVEVVVDTMLPVIAAIGAAHDERVVHRDLKPENIFLAHTKQGAVIPKVLDFGISKLSDGNNTALTGTGSLLGTPSYMAPEQARGRKDLDARCDQYSLGVIVYECLTGHLPFEEDSLYPLLIAIGAGAFRAPRELRPDIPAGLEAIVQRAMALEPDARFESVYALGRALLPFASPQSQANWSSVFTAERLSAASPLRASDASDAPGARPRASSTLGYSAREIDSINLLPAPRRPARLWLAGGFAVAAAIVAVAFALRDPGAPAAAALAAPSPTRVRPALAPATFRVATTVTPATAHLELDGAPVGAGSLERTLPVDGAPHALRVSAPGFVPQTLSFRDSAPPATIALAPEPPSTPPEPVTEPEPEPRRRHGSRHHRGSQPDEAAPTSHRRTVNGAPILE